MTSLEADLLIAAVVACFILQTIALIMMLGKQKGSSTVDTMRRDSITAYWLEIYEIGSDEMRLPTDLYWEKDNAGEAGKACVSDEMFGHHTVRAVDVIRVSITRHPTVNGVEKE